VDLVGELKSFIDSPDFGKVSHERKESIATTFTNASVQLAHGFKSQIDYDSFNLILEKCILLESEYNSFGIAESLSMILCQLCRNNVEFYSNEDKLIFLYFAAELARKFPDEKSGLIQRTIYEISGQYSQSLINRDFDTVKELVEMLGHLLKRVEGQEYSPPGRIRCSVFVEASLNAFVENDISIDFAEEILDLLHSSPAIAFPEATFGFESKYYARANQALNSEDFAVVERCKAVMNLFLQYFPDRNIPILLEALDQNISRRFPGHQ
jgi:hypothetical protein